MADHRDPQGLRWLNVIVRTLHMVGVVLVGAAVLADDAPLLAGLILTLSTGLVLYGIELVRQPDFWKEIAGLFIPVKLALLLAVPFVPDSAGALFWLVLVASSIVSHAPRTFRRRKLSA